MPSPSLLEPAAPPVLVEALESRIAPAALIDAAVPNSIAAVTVGTPQLLDATHQGQPTTLATSNVGGSYLIHVDAGAALVFTTDHNGNGQFEFNEITGIALSDGARVTLFTDVHGDVATNLQPTGSGSFQLTDSDNDVANGRDGLILLPSNVPNITLRSVTNADLNTNVPGETAVNRLALSGYSIFGNVYVGGDLGVAGVGANHVGAVSGLVIDTSGAGLQAAKFNGFVGVQFFPGLTTPPSVGSIKAGTAASFGHLTFGNSFGNSDVTGELLAFTQAPSTHGGDISGIHGANNAPFSVNVLAAGDGGKGVGGAGARGGNVTDVTFNGETGGYQVLAGNGGAGVTGGVGGSVTDFSDLGSITSLALVHSGDGGRGNLLGGGGAGTVSLGTVSTVANLRVLLGSGGDGLTLGGAGPSQSQATITPPEGQVPLGIQVTSTTRDAFTFLDSLSGQPTANPQPGDKLATVLDPGTGQMVAVHAYDIGATRSVDFDGDGYSDAIYTSANPDQLVVLFGQAPGSDTANFLDTPAQFAQRITVAPRGGGTVIDPSKTIFLDAPFGVGAVTIADFNADGRPDIAVAGGDVGSFGGINVFLNQVHDTVHNPVNGRIFTSNPLGDRPFSDALHSVIPTLPNRYVGLPVETQGNFFQSPVAITNLAAGDFNGDGVLDLAYVGTYRTIVGGGVGLQAVTAVLFGDTDANRSYGAGHVTDQGVDYGHRYGNGFFYANPALPTDAPASRVQFSASPGPIVTSGPQLIATSLVSDTPGASLRVNQPAPLGTFNAGQHDSLFVAATGAGITEFVVDFNRGVTNNLALAHQPFRAVLSTELPIPDTGRGFGTLGLGQVDTNRLLSTVDRTTGALIPNVTLVDASLQAFTILDFNNDGSADVAASSGDPAQFILQFTGPGNTAPIPTSPNAYKFTDASTPFSNPPDMRVRLENRGFPGTALALKPTDAGSTSAGLALFQLGAVAEGFSSRGGQMANPPSGTLNPDFFTFAVPLGSTVQLNTRGGDATVVSFDLYRTLSGQNQRDSDVGFQALSASKGNAANDFLDFSFRGGFVRSTDLSLTANGVEIRGGDGGSALGFGNGGQGGTIGGTLSVTGASPTGSVTVVLPAYVAYTGEVTLRAGDGGAGFTGAGNGGDIVGAAVRYAAGVTVLTSDAQLIAGTGGFATGGTGGRGGDISQIAVASGSFFRAGTGGGGLNGNRGGNITGNTLGIPDTTDSTVTALAGDGGVGRVNGGFGGSVTNFRGQFLNIIGGTGGLLNYVAGDGGAGGGGTGGAGGDLLNDSPDRAQNALSGPILLTAGAGGAGLTGGRGGNVDSFVNAPSTQSALPTSVTALGGNGGTGVTGFGGIGGSIRNVNVAATGSVSGTNANTFLVGLNKAIAGAGGASFGLDGGAGGSITASTITSTTQPFAASSGAGGAGLLSGGLGGTLNTTAFNSAGTAQRSGKVLVIAGAGGDASAVDVNDVSLPSDPLIPGRAPSLARQTLAVGGQSGVGGDGGSIIGFTQRLSIQVNVDLVAGNGGSIRYGNSITPTGNVGRGGSITNAEIAGDVGSIGVEAVSNVSPPIRAYNDVDGNGTVDESLAQFVANTLRPQGTLLVSFNDGSLSTANGIPVAVGNVGIVAGIAGRVAAVNGVAQPALGTPNGAVTNVTARNVMSIVAGSVDSVAPVDNVANLRVTSGERIFGADKSPTTPGLPGFRPTGTGDTVVQYLDLTGRVVNDLQPGDRLIDGAIYTFANTTGDLQSSSRVIILG